MKREINFLVLNGKELPTDLKLFFGEEKVELIKPPVDMYDLLVEAEVFPSKSQARKNWKKTGQDIPGGFSCFENIGKLKRCICVLNPI
jgi:hypothetical protein